MAAEAGHDESFGLRLRRHRVAANLTQEALAERAGLSVNAVSMLERGVRRIPRPSTVAMLARALRLDPVQQRDLVGAAPPPAVPAVLPDGADHRGVRPRDLGPRIPSGPAAHFVGREPELARLHRLLQGSGRVAVHGLGGVGKTQLVARYLDQRRAEYPDGAFWLRADQESSILSDLASLAWHMALPERRRPEQDQQIAAVIRWLRAHPRWLLVLDNMEPAARDVLDRLLAGLPGHLLLTSRTPTWDVRLGLGPLPPETSRSLLLQRTGQDDAKAAGTVAEALGGLPLALTQAAAYLEVSGRDLASYAELLRTRLIDLMAEARPDDYPWTVATTWRLSFELLEDECPAAAALLRLCAFLAPDDIPISVLQAGAHELDEDLREVLTDDIGLDRSVGALRRYSLVERQGDRLSVHRLVQAVVRESLPADRRHAWLVRAIRLLAAVVPDDPSNEAERWLLSARLVAHAQVVDQLTRGDLVEPGPLGRLLDLTGKYLWARGEFGQGRPFFDRALAIREETLGPDHPDTAETLDCFALLLWQRGELAAARPLAERALGIRERVLGPDHVETALSLNNLASLLSRQGELAAARSMHERALAIRERALGPDDLGTANSLNNLGQLLLEMGELAAAGPLLHRALATCEGRLGPEHPHTAVCLHNLGHLLHEQGETAAARPLIERALAIRERVLSPSHYQTARSRELLARMLSERREDPGE
jgi:transcriptional regulator with XRE-family HTH domain/tetratricopeptide (TPR) repeat protein